MKSSTPKYSQGSSAEAGQAFRKKALKVSSKIALLSFSMVLLTVVVLTAIVVVQKSRLAPVLGNYLDNLAFEEADKMLQTIRDTCAAAQAQAVKKLDHNLAVARDLVQQKGSVSLRTEPVVWEAENQVTHQRTKLELPKLMIGNDWLGQNFSTATNSPIVDDMKHFTESEATIFQRVNEAGDMLRVSTSIVKADGTRAIGTYIPALNADGTPNPIMAAVLKGETYRGRAEVLDAWHQVVYEPLWDAAKLKVIGMLFVGSNMTDVTQAVRQTVMKVALGKSGYMFVFGTKGDLRGRYLISKDGKRDGETHWETKGVDGTMTVQDMIRKGLESKSGRSTMMSYAGIHPVEGVVREKFVALGYYEPWDWLIGNSGYYDEYRQSQSVALDTLTQLLWWTVGVAIVLTIVAAGVSYRLSLGITRPLTNLTETAQLVAGGDNAARMAVESDDEIGLLGDAFNSMLDARIKAKEDTDDYKKLQEGIQQLLQVTADASDGDLTVRAPVTDGALGNVSDAVNLMLENVGTLIKNVQESAKMVAKSAMEIQASSEQLSRGANTQNQEIVNTSSAVQEMAANTESVSTNAGAANEAANRAKRASEEGAKAVLDVITGMDRIRANVQAGAKKIKRLGERSMEISTIVSTINQISAQTDMLALNAAIEAARAGEHGRGFTVVAEEVRKLAERAAAATQEIEKLVASIQAETNESVTSMEQQTSQVEDGSKIVTTAGASLERIREASVQSAELINEITLAAKQQVRGANGVVVAMQTVSQIAQQAQNGAGETKRSTESLVNLANALLGQAAKFKV